jgi:hypothetical protein
MRRPSITTPPPPESFRVLISFGGLSHHQGHSNPSSRTAALGLTQPLTDVSARKLPGV